jgi:group I intron endonuclease
MGWIYRIISPSGKSYIGQTVAANVNKRWNEEKRTPHGLLRHVFKKYGSENCIFEELMEITEASHGPRWQEYLDFWEKNCIQEFNSLRPHGYNSTDGGKNCKFHDASRERMRQAQLGKKLTDVTRARMSASRKGEKHPFYGKTHSTKSRRKMSKALKGKMAGALNPNYGKPMNDETKNKMRATKIAMDLRGERAANSKKIEQWSIDGQTIIKIWANAREAERILKTEKVNINYKNISSVCRGLRPTAGGFIWKLVKDDGQLITNVHDDAPRG